MIAQPRVRKAWWMSARISQRIRSRRNQRRSAKAASTTQRFLPRPLPCSVPRRGNERADAQLTDLATVDVVVVTAAGVQDVGAPTGTSALAADGRYGVDQGQEPGDVVAVATGHGGGQSTAVVGGGD